MGLLGKAVNWLSLAVAILMMVCGAIHVGRSIEDWCKESLALLPTDSGFRYQGTAPVQSDYSIIQRQDRICAGPWLYWEISSRGLDDIDRINAQWSYLVFNLIPNLFFDQWTPFFMGLLSADIHFGDDHWELVSDNWARKCMWHVFIALFGGFGYAGKLGIINGFLCVLVSALCIVVMFVDPEERPSLGIRRGDDLHAHERRKSDAGLTVYKPQMSKANIADEGLGDDDNQDTGAADEDAVAVEVAPEQEQEDAPEEEYKEEVAAGDDNGTGEAEAAQEEAEPEAADGEQEDTA